MATQHAHRQGCDIRLSIYTRKNTDKFLSSWLFQFEIPFYTYVHTYTYTHTRSPTPPVLYTFETADEVSKQLAEFVIAAQNDALNKRGAFKLAISGGSLAATLAKNLVGNDRVQWEKW